MNEAAALFVGALFGTISTILVNHLSQERAALERNKERKFEKLERRRLLRIEKLEELLTGFREWSRTELGAFLLVSEVRDGSINIEEYMRTMNETYAEAKSELHRTFTLAKSYGGKATNALDDAFEAHERAKRETNGIMTLLRYSPDCVTDDSVNEFYLVVGEFESMLPAAEQAVAAEIRSLAMLEE